jgi:hypothetical protein
MADRMNDIEKADAELDALDRAKNAEQGGKRQVWERQAGESAKAYAAFAKYRDMSAARTMAKVAEMSQCSAQNIHRWARRWFWTQRCYEFDLVEEEKFREQTARDRMAHRRQQIQLGTVLTNIAAHSLREFQQRIEQQLPLNFDPAQVAALLKLGDEMKSRGLGEDKGGGKYTRINVVLGTAPDIDDIDDAPAESRPALFDDTTGEGFEPKPKPN